MIPEITHHQFVSDKNNIKIMYTKALFILHTSNTTLDKSLEETTSHTNAKQVLYDNDTIFVCLVDPFEVER